MDASRSRAPLPAAVALIAALAGDAAAAGPATDPRDARAIAATVARWRAKGPAALPEAARALCDRDSDALPDAALAHLRAAGLPAVTAMIAAENSPSRPAGCDADQHVPEILCVSNAGAGDELDRAVAALARNDGPKGSTGRGLERLQQALTRPSYLKAPCPNAERIARALASRALPPRELAARPARQRAQLIALAEAMGPEAAPYAPTLASWLDDPGSGIAAARALGRIGAGGAPAVPALIRFVERRQREPSYAQGSLGYDFPREDALVAGIQALGAIGADAKPAAPLLPPLLHAAIDRFDQGHHANVAVAILEALPRLGPPVPASVVADVAATLGRRQTGARPTPPAGSPRSLSLHRRPGRAISDSRASTIGIMGGPEITWAQLVAAAGQLGPAAASLAPALTPLMLGPEVDLRLRAAAAGALGQIGARLPADAEATRRMLVGRGDWLDALERRVGENKDWRDAERSSRFVREVVDRCGADTGLAAAANTGGDLARQPEGYNIAFTYCLGARVCGPHPRDRDIALRTCCDYAYPGTQPALCGGGARAAAPAPRPVASTPTVPPPAVTKPARPPVAVAKPIAPPPAPVKIANPGLALRAVWGEYDLRHTAGGRIVAAGFRRDGSYVSVGDRGSVRVWDMAKRRLLADWSALITDDTAERAALSPDGAHAALWLRARHRLVILRVGDARTPSAVLHEIADARAIRALAFAGADALFSVGVFANPATEVRSYDVATGTVRAGLPVEEAYVLAVSPDGGTVVVAGLDWMKAWRATLNDFPLWSLPLNSRFSDGCRHTSDHLSLCLPSLAFTRDGSLLLGHGPPLVLLDARTGKTLKRFVGLAAADYMAVEDIVAAPDGQQLVSVSRKEGPILRFWDVPSARETARVGDIRHLAAHERDIVAGIAFAPDGAGFVHHGGVNIVPWDGARRAVVPRAGHDGAIQSMRVSPDGAKLLTGSGADGSVRQWDAATGREVGRWDKLGARVEIAPDGARMLIADVVSAAVVDAAGGRPLWSRRDLVYAAYARLSPDGKAVASLSTKEGLCLHRAADGVRVWCNGVPGVQSGYEGRLLAFSPDGQAIIAPGGRRQDWKLFLWDAKSGKPIGPLGPRIESLPSVVGASGAWALLGDPLLQTVPLPKAAGKDYLAPLAVSADRRLLAGTDVEGRALHLVTLADGKPLNHVDLSPMGDLARAAAFSPDGTRLFVGTERGMILVFAVSL